MVNLTVSYFTSFLYVRKLALLFLRTPLCENSYMTNVKNDITSYLQNNHVLTLAVTESSGTPWVCTVYYGLAEDLTMYLVTGINSRHGKCLVGEQKVAYNIFDSHITITQNKQGVQGTGLCTVVTHPLELLKGLSLWHNYNPGVENAITVEEIQKSITRRLVKLEPKYLKFFNKELYGKAEYGILEL
jgi:nitroimidazol reductase NimA-like FMN-containing flavoprotein (pyridoxamine 5'-phosphate oxidase superfamily)